jgi:hypothetical protein
MNTSISSFVRLLDGRTVYMWELTDDHGRLCSHGCELSYAAAKAAAGKAKEDLIEFMWRKV